MFGRSRAGILDNMPTDLFDVLLAQLLGRYRFAFAMMVVDIPFALFDLDASFGKPIPKVLNRFVDSFSLLDLDVDQLIVLIE